MEIIVRKDELDFDKVIKMGQFFMYEEFDNGYFVYSEEHICQITIYKDKSILSSDDIVFWQNYFSLNEDYISINKNLLKHCEDSKDNYGIHCINTSIGVRLCKQPYLETCIEYLLSAQNNIKRIRNSMLKLLEYGELKTDLSIKRTYHCFPNLEILKSLKEKDFIDCGAGFRAKYIVDFLNNYKNPNFTDTEENIMKFLISYKGIGPKVASCIALYALNQRNSFPIDVWIKKVLDKYYPNNSFVKPTKDAGILQVYMYENIRNESF